MAMVYYVRLSLCFLLFMIINIRISKSLGLKNIECEQEGPCRCLKRDGTGIDLSPLINTTTGTHFLTAIAEIPKVIFFYHPCSDWPLHSHNQTECTNGASICYYKANTTNLDVNHVLTTNISEGEFKLLAIANQGKFEYTTSDEPQLVYTNGTIVNTIELKCVDQSKPNTIRLKTENENKTDITNNVLILESYYSCVRDLSSHSAGHMSGAGVFFLIIVSIFALYFFGGMLVLRFIRGATGKEMIPNYEFWANFPNLVKEGFLYVVSCGQRVSSDSYERI